MRPFKFLSLFISLLILISACGGNRQNLAAETHVQLPNAGAMMSPPSRLLIKTAQLSVEVENPKTTANQITTLISTEKGYVENRREVDKSKISMSVKIPEKKLIFFIEKVSSMGTVISKSVNSRDVTEQVTDIEAKLANLKLLREKFRKLLKKAKNVTETLAIEAELSRLQIDIDSIESRKKWLKNQVSYSNVTINLGKKTVYGPLGYLGHGLFWFFEKLFIIE
ncbi:MAG: DUF4349 domain-containing protein [Methylococcales bacterium]|nr:DUF4349 domain-containing protein [Methylococcales bacterium]MCK5924712.1 DUF4349 domain-containing protein [Methylococcales bacterium]